MKQIIFITIVLALAGCMTPQKNQHRESISNNAPTASSENSRIRLFGQNGTGVVLYRNSQCVKSSLGDEDERVSGALLSAFGSMIGMVSNSPIGMPETDTTRNLNKKNLLLSTVYFREYVIAGNKPVTIRSGFQQPSHTHPGTSYFRAGASCSVAVSFLPVAGEDYEASFNFSGGGCSLGVNRILESDGVTTLQPVELYAARACENK